MNQPTHIDRVERKNVKMNNIKYRFWRNRNKVKQQ